VRHPVDINVTVSGLPINGFFHNFYTTTVIAVFIMPGVVDYCSRDPPRTKVAIIGYKNT
jgi:hypothetical protein